jgi:hypothetical protein
MEWWDHQDQALRLCLRHLGETVVIFAPGGDPSGTVVWAKFDTVRARADLGLVLELSNQAPAINFRVADLPNAEPPEQGWQFDARGALWEITDVEPDGGGAVRCHCFRIGPGSIAPLPPLSVDYAEAEEPFDADADRVGWR